MDDPALTFAELQTRIDDLGRENVRLSAETARLFNELQNANADASEALDRQAAMAEVLEIISRSPAEVAPVFEAVVEKAVRLCGAEYCVLYRVEGQESEIVASFIAGDDVSRYPPVGTVRPLEGRVLFLDTRPLHAVMVQHVVTLEQKIKSEPLSNRTPRRSEQLALFTKLAAQVDPEFKPFARRGERVTTAGAVDAIVGFQKIARLSSSLRSLSVSTRFARSSPFSNEINPSRRPSFARPERYDSTCERPSGSRTPS